MRDGRPRRLRAITAAAVWSSSRLSNPAASRDCRPVQHVPILRTATKPNAAVITHPSSLSGNGFGAREAQSR